MLNQTFTPLELMKLVTNKDIKKFSLGRTDESIRSSMTKISYAVSEPDFKFENIKKSNVKGRDVFTDEVENEYFAIKKINHIIRRLYGVSQSNRNDILNQVIKILSDGYSYKVIRADIRDFFDNVARGRLVKKLKSDSMLGSLMINKLNQLEKTLSYLSCKGLPRGISLSSTLSEIYLRDFDYEMKCCDGVYYYARYVDDIIIICIENITEVEKALKQGLKKIDLELNDKYKVVDGGAINSDFDYLGVNFNFSKDKTRFLLSSNKVKQYKTRIILSILDYRKNLDTKLLVRRMKFITSNYRLFTKTESNNLKAGIYYNNQFINDYSQLSSMNEFIRKSFSSKKGSLSKVIKNIPKPVITECLQCCFFKGYINKEMIYFTPKEIANIVRCWDHG